MKDMWGGTKCFNLFLDLISSQLCVEKYVGL